MEIPQSPEGFRHVLGEWLDASDAPPRSDTDAWAKRLANEGLLAPAWPREHGGRGLDREAVKVLEQELRARGIRRPVNAGLTMLGPVLMEFASPEQLLRFLPPIARGESTWAQGYSEPQAGSDLANVQMRAEDRGDHYLVNGQKIWTSGADQANWIFCLVRTDFAAPKHEGISFLLVELGSPGVDVAPITLISGRSPFCEVFFSDVSVPKANLIGEPGKGWTIAKRLLQFERSMLGSEGLSSLTGGAGRMNLAEIATRRIGTDASGRLVDALLRDRLARQLVAERADRLTSRRAGRLGSGTADAARISSILKLVNSETNQRRYDLIVDLLGNDAFGWQSDGFSDFELSVPVQWLRSRANTIEGGTSEIQLNIIAKRVLGLPSGPGGLIDLSIAVSEEQELIRDAALKFLRKEQPLKTLRALRDSEQGFSASFWQAACELGWPGILVPEEDGGAGLGFRELGVVFESVGRHLAATPLSSCALAISCLRLAGGQASHADLLGRLAAGTSIVALALDEASRFDPGALQTRADVDPNGFRISGSKRVVLDGGVADALIVVARTSEHDGGTDRDGISLLLVDPKSPGVAVQPLRLLDGRRASHVTFESVRVAASALLGPVGAAGPLLEALIDRAAVILACELVGIMATSFEMTLEYMMTREQFGQPIGSFQALQHRAARRFSEIELCISVVQDALAAIDEGRDDASLAASAAKALASDTARRVTEDALQIFGGIGMTEEHDIGLFFKRARIASTLFGDASFHYERFARLHSF